jgi:DNA polymerase-3 subunit epsilon
MRYLTKLNRLLVKSPISIIQFNDILTKSETFFESVDLETELLISNGYPIFFKEENVYLKTTINTISDQVFCIVDIETTHGNPKKGQLLEIAAVKLKNGKKIEEYHSLVNCDLIPKKVEEITGISHAMVEKAPNIKEVLEEFKLFLEDDLFVAHSVNFDYNFLGDSMEQYGLGRLYNRQMCTIELAKRTIEAPKYGLKTLKEVLGIDELQEHRAMDDVLATVDVFKKSLSRVPSNVVTAEGLIGFSKQGEIINKEEK